jgi:hypothetical protein
VPIPDEINAQGGANPFQQEDRTHHTADLEPRRGWLRHANPGGEFDLRQTLGKSAFANRAWASSIHLRAP